MQYFNTNRSSGKDIRKLGKKRGLTAGVQDQFRVEEADGLKRSRNDVGLLKLNVVEDKLPVRSSYCLNCAEDNL